MSNDFETSEVSAIVGVKPFYLNKFIEREHYGIRPSIRTGKGRGSRRRFSEDDVYGIALIWLLFTTGLRKKTIEGVLDEIGEGEHLTASQAAKRLRECEAQLLILRHEPDEHLESEDELPGLRVKVEVLKGRHMEFDIDVDFGTQVYSVGLLFKNVAEKIAGLE